MKDSLSKEVNTDSLDNLFQDIGWNKRGKEKWLEVLEKSSYVYSVWDEDVLIGFGRILEDGVMCMFYDIGVLSKYQSKGVGKQIMKNLIEFVKDKNYASIGLFAWEENPNNISFYEKSGFEKSGSGMELTKYMIRE